MPSGLSALQGTPVKEKASPRVQAYWARNEAAACEYIVSCIGYFYFC